MLVNPEINFLGARKKGYIICLVLVIIGGVSFGLRGLNKGIDFSGGRNYIVRFDKSVNTQEIANLLKPEFGENIPTVITIGGDNQVRISTNYRIEESDDAIDEEILTMIYKGLKDEVGGKSQEAFETENVMSIQKVGPSIAEDITIGAIWAVIISLIAIALYILLRFRDVAFSVGTLVSLAFDTLIILSVYSIFNGLLPFSMEIDQTFIAAILTNIGYSVNDKVVVFDRVREVIGLYPKRDRGLVINDALNSTLSRTISTSLSTALVLLSIFILGGDTIRSFSFAMLLGVITGTFSTLFVAVPIAYEMMKKKFAKLVANEAA